MRAAKVQASLRIRAVSPEPLLLAHTSSESRGTFRQKARSLAPLNGWTCAVKVCHDGMLEDTNSLDGAQVIGIYELTAYDNGDLITQQPDKGDDSRFYAKIWLYPSHYLVCKIFSSYLTEFVLYAMDSQS